MRNRPDFRALWGARLIIGVGLAGLVVAWFYATDPFGGADTTTRVQFLAWSLVAALPAYLVRRVLTGEARSHEAWRAALGIVPPLPRRVNPDDPTGPKFATGADVDERNALRDRSPVAAAILWAAHQLVAAAVYVAIILGLGVVGSARAAEPPPRAALDYLPTLRAELAQHWPDAPDVPAVAAQVEQETCVSLRSRLCWSPRAELKTLREYGFGLGQLTVTPRFNNFDAARMLDASLVHWQWADRFDAAQQLRVLVLMDRQAFRGIAHASDPRERLAMALSAYNGGAGGLAADRRLCGQAPACDPARWWGNVETHSLKARAAATGYGQSFFSINRGYVRAVLVDRRVRYVAL